MHNYRSNQSALMTRCGTDLRHRYGIFGGKSQTSFSRNAIRAGSEEGRLFSQANLKEDSTTNGPQGTVSQKTQTSIELLLLNGVKSLMSKVTNIW